MKAPGGQVLHKVLYRRLSTRHIGTTKWTRSVYSATVPVFFTLDGMKRTTTRAVKPSSLAYYYNICRPFQTLVKVRL